MTLRAMWTYDHVANPSAITVTSVAAYTATGAYNILTGNVGTPILRTGSSNMTINQSNNATAPGYLLMNNAGQGQQLAVALTDLPLLQNGSTKAYIGFRTIATALVTPATNSIVGVGSSATVAPTPLLTEAQLNRTLNVAQFVEVMIDQGNSVYSVWVDGLPVITGAALPTGWTYLLFGSGVSLTTGVVGVRDFYFADADSQTTKRLGPIQSYIAPLVTVTAPNYTSSDAKTPLVDLTTAYSGAPTAIPTITNAPTNDPITANFQSNLPAGGSCIAVQYKMAASVPMASKMGVAITNGTQTVTPPAYQFNDTSMDYGRDLAGLQVNGPSGNPWGAVEFAATSLVLTPQSLT
jgi:hypothetical protein